jgi:sugar lactone lactonase YvrE
VFLLLTGFFSQPIPVAHAQLTCNEPHILVSQGLGGPNGNNLRTFNSTNFTGGTLLTSTDTVAGLALNDTHDIKIGPDGLLYIADTRNNRIVRYNLTTSSSELVSNVPYPFGITFNANGDLYVTGGGTEFGGNRVFRLDMTASLPISRTTFIPSTGTGYTLNRLHEGIEFDSNGDLYVVVNNGLAGYRGVLRFNSSGTFVTQVIPTVSFVEVQDYNLRDIAFGSDGNLYLSHVQTNQVVAYNPASGVVVHTITATAPVGMAFAPNGELFAAEYNSGGVGQVNRFTFNGTSWSLAGSFGNALLDQTKAIAFTHCLDWGDLPHTYGTTAESNGPRHIINSTLRLGACVDPDANGQPDSGATGDDIGPLQPGRTTHGTCAIANDDEDGVTFPRPVDDLHRSNWSDGTGHINITVTGGDACVNVWVDFGNGSATPPNGQFDVGAGLGLWNEHVVVNQTVTTGVTQLNFSLPLNVANDATLGVRVRLTPRDADIGCASAEAYQGGVVSPLGLATGGEIEDYIVNFSPTAVSLSQNFIEPAPANPNGYFALYTLILALITGTILYRWQRRH